MILVAVFAEYPIVYYKVSKQDSNFYNQGQLSLETDRLSSQRT